MEEYFLEEINIEELDETLHLVKKVFDEFEAPCYSEEGIKSFYDFTDYNVIKQKLTENMKMFVVKDNKKIIGMIAFRDFKHICMLFVDKEYHKKGIGKKLVEIAINICKSCNDELKTVTVNSSPYAVEFYHKIGFKDIENEKIEDGIRFTPMSYNLV